MAVFHHIWFMETGDAGHIPAHAALGCVNMQHRIYPIRQLMQMRRTVKGQIRVLVRRKAEAILPQRGKVERPLRCLKCQIPHPGPVAILLGAHVTVLQRADVTAVDAQR